MLNKTVINCSFPNVISKMRDILCKEIYSAIRKNREIVILCIGTDRSTGDSLGPLVGEKLKFLVREKVHLYGDLENPVHAKNLPDIILQINNTYENPYVIAIDACLGKLDNIGNIIIDSRPLRPGSAMNKDLPTIGDLSITGIVNMCGALEFMVLQNTRLYTVMKLADYISKGLYHSILKTVGGKNHLIYKTEKISKTN